MTHFKIQLLKSLPLLRLSRRLRFIVVSAIIALVTLLTSTLIAVALGSPAVEIDPTKFPAPLENLSIGGTVERINVPIQANQKELIYQFDSVNSVNLTLTNLTRDLDVQLLDSGLIEWARSVNPGIANESINVTDLPQDTYTLRIYKPDNDSSAGIFVLRASNNVPTNLLARENGFPNVPTLQSSLTFSGSLSARDTSDLYRFTFPSNAPSTTKIRVRLEGLKNTAELRLIRETSTSGNRAGIIDNSDEVLNISSSSGTQNVLTQLPTGAGDYFVQVDSPNNGDPSQSRATRYKLMIDRV